MEKKVYSIAGEEVGTVSLDDAVFGRSVSEGSIYYAIKAELANARVGTASVKTRGQVRGSTAKPWRQKGTGRARSGHKRSPVWRGGGVVFGPQKRDYTIRIPRKLKRLAICSILSMKAKEETHFKVIEDFSINSGKTKDFSVILKNHSIDERVVVIAKDDDSLLKRAGRNIPFLTVHTYNKLRAHDLFYGKKIVVMKSAIESLNSFYGGVK